MAYELVDDNQNHPVYDPKKIKSTSRSESFIKKEYKQKSAADAYVVKSRCKTDRKMQERRKLKMKSRLRGTLRVNDLKVDASRIMA